MVSASGWAFVGPGLVPAPHASLVISFTSAEAAKLDATSAAPERDCGAPPSLGGLATVNWTNSFPIRWRRPDAFSIARNGGCGLGAGAISDFRFWILETSREVESREVEESNAAVNRNLLSTSRLLDSWTPFARKRLNEILDKSLCLLYARSSILKPRIAHGARRRTRRHSERTWTSSPRNGVKIARVVTPA
jgi:hypothetical protein